MTVDEEDIVRQDVGVALANVTVGVMLSVGLGIEARWWWVGVLATGITIVLAVASDRHRAGLRALLVTATLAIVALVWGWSTDAIAIEILPIVLIGIGVGFCFNRVLFGFVRPLPEARKRREQST